MRVENSIAPIAPDAELRERECSDLVVDLCRSGLLGIACPEPALRAERIDLDGFAALVGSNRLWSACARGFAASGVAPPAALAEAIRAGRGRALILNARVIATARYVLPRLREHGIDAVTMKGPLFYHLLHGDFLFRRSNDLDLLVPRAQFGAAKAVLAKLGFQTDPAHAGSWWTFSLGEIHLSPDDPGHCVVDLHHRVQQPGCPAPRDISLFLSDPAVVELADVAVPSISRMSALLLACLTLAKGVVHRSPSGMHAYDVAAGFLRLDAGDRAAFWRLASRQRLVNTVRFALTAAERVFNLPLQSERMAEAGVSDKPVPWFNMVFRPDREGLVWPRRRELLWQMCDGDGPGTRAASYGQEAGRVLAGEMLRRWAARGPRQ